LQWTGIPCCIGIGPTKTLAKAGNKLAKKTKHGVVVVDDPLQQLANYPAGELWGIGRKWSAKLGAEGILTAADLMHADPETLRARYGVTLARTQTELLGVTCIELQEEEPDRKQIVVSRSFGRDVIGLEQVSEALATFAIRAAQKMRMRALQASAVRVWLHTNPFKPGAAQYHPSRAMQLITATSDTREILTMAQALLRSIYRDGYAYKKAGVELMDLSPGDMLQGDLFAAIDPRSAKLMSVLDTANSKFGKGTMGFGSSGWREKPLWGMRQENLSPSYTTRWDQLLRVS